MDKLRAIKLFCKTAETKSFTAAARDLDVPQSVLSKTISALETDLQLKLFNRSTRQLSLTEAGASYYNRCKQILVDVDEAEALARHGTDQATGTLRIGIHPVFQISLCRRIGEFIAKTPNVNVEIRHTNSPASLVEVGLDVLLRVGAMKESALVARQLGSTALILCASPSYLQTHARPSHPRDLIRQRHCAIIPNRHDEDSFARWIFSKGEEREVVKLPASVMLREGVGLGVAAVGGVGLVAMYDIAARPFFKDGSLEWILQDWSLGRQPVYAVTQSGGRVPAKVRAFVEFSRSLV
jgi:DNA-binding transcriptional LysR family regulator